jgi:hypothetical protein
MCLEAMNRMMNKLKLIGGLSSLIALMWLMACAGPQFEEPFDSEEQLEKDIELIEAYLADKGYTDYDTLDNDIRALVLDEGVGEPIEPNDIISFQYVGIFLNDTIFDTSIAKLAYFQDTINAVGNIVFEYDDDDEIVYDINGFAKIDSITYANNYSPIYFETRAYASSKTTHTTTGWYTEQVLTGTVSGYPPSVNYALFNCNIGGRALAIFPSSQAYGNVRDPNFQRFRNRVIMFEIRPVQKR